MTFPRTMQLPGSILPGQGPCLDKVFDDDFAHIDEGADGKWIRTDTGSGSAIITEDGMLYTLGTSDNDSEEMQGSCGSAGGAFALNANRDIYGYCRLKFNDVDLVDWFVGLATLDTAVLDGTTDAVGLCASTGTGILNTATASVFAVRGSAMGAAWSAATFVDTGVDILDDTFFDIAWWIEGITRMRFYVNGKELVNVTTGDFPLVGVRMTPTMCFQDQSTAESITVQRYYCSQVMAV